MWLLVPFGLFLVVASLMMPLGLGWGTLVLWWVGVFLILYPPGRWLWRRIRR